MKRLKWILSGGLCLAILPRPAAVVPWFILFFEFPSLVFSQDFWTEIPAPATSYTYSSSNRIVITPDDEIYIVADDGIHKSTDGGETWEFLIDGDEPLYVSETGILYARSGSRGMVLLSSNGGQSWDSLPVPHSYGFSSLLETSDSQILLGIRNTDAVFRSDDGGLSFSLVFGDSTKPLFSDWNSLLQDSAGRIYAKQDYRTEIYISADNGDSWDTLPMPYVMGYYVSRSGKVFYSTQTGSVLTPNHAGTALIEHARVDSALGIPGSMVCVRDDGLLLVSNAYDIAASYDNGLTWSLMDMSGIDTTGVFPDNIGIVDMEVDSEGYVYVYGPRGLYKNAEVIGPVALGDPYRHLRAGGSLLKVIQNHFEGKTRIHFPLSKRGFLKILGMGGKTFASYDVSNRTGIVWEGKDRGGRLLPAGTYIIEANLDGTMAATRLMLFR